MHHDGCSTKNHGCAKGHQRAHVGQPAPDFTVEGAFGKEFKKVSLSDYKGKWVVLFFYPLDFTFVCPTEITAFNDAYDKLQDLNTEILSMSTDSVFSHKAWMENGLGQMKFGMLSDMTKQVSRDYGVLIEEEGIALRGVFLIDPEGMLKMAVVHDNSIGRNVDEVIRVVQAAQTGQLCPVGWKPGDKTLGEA